MNFNPNASDYHINLHRETLIASIKYDENRGIDCVKQKEELAELEDFYSL